MVGARFDEDRAALLHRDLLPCDLQDPCAFEDDVELVVLVRLLPVRLGRDEDVHAKLETGGFVDDFIPSAGLGKPPLGRCNLE
jgi:hypothetical protein